LKIGGEFIYQGNPVFLCNTCMGSYDMSGGPVPSNIEQLFPVWNDVSTWNLAALSKITRSYTDHRTGEHVCSAERLFRVDSGRLDHRTAAHLEPWPAVRL
jgi:hypothetical protein